MGRMATGVRGMTLDEDGGDEVIEMCIRDRGTCSCYAVIYHK